MLLLLLALRRFAGWKGAARVEGGAGRGSDEDVLRPFTLRTNVRSMPLRLVLVRRLTLRYSVPLLLSSPFARLSFLPAFDSSLSCFSFTPCFRPSSFYVSFVFLCIAPLRCGGVGLRLAPSVSPRGPFFGHRAAAVPPASDGLWGPRCGLGGALATWSCSRCFLSPLPGVFRRSSSLLGGVNPLRSERSRIGLALDAGGGLGCCLCSWARAFGAVAVRDVLLATTDLCFPFGV
jgi:hypothetical protein